jgi:nucleoside 2-deoxyribosyltransferase
MVQAYLSGPIVSASLRKDEFYRVVVDTLEELGIAVFAPQFAPRLAPHDVFRRDTNEVRMCDFLVAEVSNPSLGVGMEIMLAIELVKPVLMFQRKDSKDISFMALGADGKALFEYESTDEVRKILLERNLENLMVQQCPSCAAQVAEVTDEGLRCLVCLRKFMV